MARKQPKGIYRAFKLASGTITLGAAEYYGFISLADIHAWLESLKVDLNTLVVKRCVVHFYVNPSNAYYHSTTPFIIVYQNGGTLTGQTSGSLSEIVGLVESGVNTPFGLHLGPTKRLTPNSASNLFYSWDITDIVRKQCRFVETRDAVHPEMALGIHGTGVASTTIGIGKVLVMDYTFKPQGNQAQLFLKG